MKALVGAFNQEKALRDCTTGCGTDGSFYSTIARPASSSYLDSRSSPSVSLSLGSHQSQSEPRRFEFLPKPCDPAKLPAKQSGEEARIASKDYRGSINSNKIYNIGELPLSKSKVGKTDNKIIRELSEKTARSFGLKKAPAPMPPVLRK